MSLRPAAPKRASEIACKIISPSECATIENSQSIKTLPKVKPLPG